MIMAIDLAVSINVLSNVSQCSYVEVARLADVIDVVPERQTTVDETANVIGGMNDDAADCKRWLD